MKLVRLLPLLGIVLIFSCAEHKPPHDDQPQEPVPAPRNIISVEQAEDLYQTYGTDRVNIIESAQNVDEDGNPIDMDDPRYIQTSRSISFDFEMIKQYIAYIEQQADSANADLTGLRVYFGKYGADAKKDPDTETVFFNPIMEYGKPGVLTDDVSFAIQNGKAVPVGIILGTFQDGKPAGKANLIMSTQDGKVESLAANVGGRRPPPPPPYDPDYQ